MCGAGEQPDFNDGGFGSPYITPTFRQKNSNGLLNGLKDKDLREDVHIYEFGRFRLSTCEKRLLRDGVPVSLTPKAFDMLAVLVENRGRLLEKSELLERVWPDSFVEEANLSVKMSELRKALGEGPNDHHYIETVPRRGYRFVADVKLLDEAAAEPETSGTGAGGFAQTSTVVNPGSASQWVERPRSANSRRWPFFLAGLLVLSGLLFAFNVAGLRERVLGGTKPVEIRSLAVLPLENISADASELYFADGMTEALISDLARISALRVISRHSVMQYRDTPRTVPEIGRELNVDAVLTGSISRSGERVRIAVQLIHAATDQNLWTHSYERDMRDVLTMQREVARDVASEIRIKLAPKEQSLFGPAAQVNAEAYDHYLRGKFYLHVQKKDENAAAIASLERAVAVDPSFAAAHAELAQAYVWKLFLFAPDEKELAEKAFMAAEKALALDPNLAVAYLARGRLLWTPANHFPHEKAIREYRRALELNPNLDEARNQLALIFNHIGALDEAIRELERAVATNPSNSLAQFRIGETLLFQEKYEQALTTLRGVPSDINPALVGHQIVWAQFNLGRKDEASATLDRFLKDFPEDNRGLLTSQQAVMAAANGQKEVAEEKIRLAVEKGKGFGHFHHTAYHIAIAYAYMNNAEQSVKWLKSTAEEGFPCYPLFENDDNLNNIRQDGRFIEFMGKLKPQWEHYRTIL